MSTTTTRRPLSEALRIAQEFHALFEDCFERWAVAGSIRRRQPLVGDAEHVVIPRQDERPVDGELMPRLVNLVLHRLDDLVAAGTVTKSIDARGCACWGTLHRKVDFRGMQHDIYLADPQNWGCILAIRTGPAEFSTRLVTSLKQTGVFRQQDGYLRYATGTRAGVIHPCPEEREYLELCGCRWLEPEARQ